MELIRGLHNVRERHHGCALSIGNFDGFHLGHQALAAQLCERAEALKVPATVQVFEPTPREFFAPEAAPGRVATLRGKLQALRDAGVERVLCTRFNRALASVPAESFVKEILVGRLGVKAVVVGDDFRFGAGRGGDLALLQRLGGEFGFTAEALAAVAVGDLRASSSAVRSALQEADLALAAKLLGRAYALTSRVRHGRKLGRTLGMPTANLDLKRRPALRYGVYAVRVSGAGGQWTGVANLGVRPTLGGSRCCLEVHLFDASVDLYGAVLEVTFVRFIRDEQRFESLDLLKDQMHQDSTLARGMLKN